MLLCAFSPALTSSASRASSILLSSGLVGVTSIVMLTVSPHPSWGPISLVGTRFTHSGLSWVSLVEVFDCEGCILEVVCRVPTSAKKKTPVGRITSPSGRYSSALYVLCVLVVLSRPHAHRFDPLRPVHASTLVSVPNAPRACLPPFRPNGVHVI